MLTLITTAATKLTQNKKQTVTVSTPSRGASTRTTKEGLRLAEAVDVLTNEKMPRRRLHAVYQGCSYVKRVTARNIIIPGLSPEAQLMVDNALDAYSAYWYNIGAVAGQQHILSRTADYIREYSAATTAAYNRGVADVQQHI